MSKASNFELRGLTIWEPGKTALPVATVNQHHPKARPYAHKLVAAPAMYEALRKLIAGIEEYGAYKRGDFMIDDVLSPARAALSLAEGK